MGYELSHDSLAKQIYQQASTEAQTRRKVEYYVHQKYDAWLERKARLTEDDLAYISPYLAIINLSESERDFLKKEKYALTNRRISKYATFAALFAVIGIAALLFTWKGQAEEGKKIAEIQKQIALTQKGIAMTRKAYAEKDITFAVELAKHQYDQDTTKNSDLYHLILQSIYHAPPLRPFYENIEKVDLHSIMDTMGTDKRLLLENKNLLTLDRDNVVRLRNPNSEVLAVYSTRKGIINFFVINSLNTLITKHVDGDLKKWDLKRSAVKNIATKTYKYDGIVNSVQFSPNGESVLTACSDSMARIHFFIKDDKTTSFPHKSAVNTAYFSPDGNKFVTASKELIIRLWDTFSGIADTLGDAIHPKAVSKAFFLDTNRVLSLSHITGAVWDTDSKELLGFDNYIGFSKGAEYYYEVIDAAASPTGDTLLLVSPYKDGTRLWNFTNLDFKAPITIEPITSRQLPSGKCAYSPDGQKLLLSKKKTIELFTNTGEKLLSRVSDTIVTALTFSKDAQYFLVGYGDGGIKMYSIKGEEVFHFHPHQQSIKSIDFSPDMQYFATSSADSTIGIWALKDHLVLAKTPSSQLFNIFTNKEKITLLNYQVGQFKALKDSMELLNLAHFYLDQNQKENAVAIYKQIEANYPNSVLLSPQEKSTYLNYNLKKFLTSDDPELLKKTALFYKQKKQPSAVKKLIQKAWNFPQGQKYVTPDEAMEYLGVDSTFFLKTTNAEIALQTARYFRTKMQQGRTSLDFVKKLYHHAEKCKGIKNWERISILERQTFLDYEITDFLDSESVMNPILAFKYFRTQDLDAEKKEKVCQLFKEFQRKIEENKRLLLLRKQYVFFVDLNWVENNCSCCME